MSEVLTPDRPRWAEFCERLAGPEGCDFTPEHTWKCAGGTDQSFARAILTDMGVDVVGTLKWCSEHGGHCDCEILFNCDRHDD